MKKCRMCEVASSDAKMGQDGICLDCWKKQGLPPRTEPSRPRVPCVRCNGTSFVRCRAIRERATVSGEYGWQYLAPLGLTFLLRDEPKGIFNPRTERSSDLEQPVGLLEAYACRTCGYVELYASQAGDIPIDPFLGTELFELGGQGPYR